MVSCSLNVEMYFLESCSKKLQSNFVTFSLKRRMSPCKSVSTLLAISLNRVGQFFVYCGKILASNTFDLQEEECLRIIKYALSDFHRYFVSSVPCSLRQDLTSTILQALKKTLNCNILNKSPEKFHELQVLVRLAGVLANPDVQTLGISSHMT